MIVNAMNANNDEPAAKPSSPSVRLTPLVDAMIRNTAQITHPTELKWMFNGFPWTNELHRVNDRLVWTPV